MEKIIPVSKNQLITVEINGLTAEGNGVARVDGFAIFVEGALPGELLEIKILKVLKNYGYGKIVNIIKPSQDRAVEPCGIVKKCGGCQLQHMTYEAQLRYKTQQVKDALERIGGFKGIEVKDTLGMGKPWNYRNKAQFPVGFDGDVKVGFYRSGTHEIVDTDNCLIQDETNVQIVKIIKDYIKEYKISIYDEEKNQGLIRHIVTRKGFTTGEVMIIIVANGDKLPNIAELAKAFKEKVTGFKSLILNVNKQRTNVILGNSNRVIYGTDYIFDYIGDFKFKISPHSFFQVNPEQTKVLYGKALEFAGLTGGEIVIDAYCGIGTISLFLSQKAKKVYGVEIVAPAIDNAKENAALNNVENVEFLLGESETVIPELYKQGIKADVLVVDPPRKGCDEKLLETIVKMQPERVVYVSCNPATLARDLKYLGENGYEIREVQPVDMFPWTVHVECVCLLVRNSKGYSN